MIVIVGLLGMALGIIISWLCFIKIYSEKYNEIKCLSDKHLEMFLVMDKWFQKERKGITVAAYLRENKFYNISIYGIGYIGVNFYEYLKKEGFEINNLIDQNDGRIIDGIEIRTMDDEYAPTDVIIVTSIYYFDELENMLMQKFNKPILSFADIVYKA